MRLLPLHLLPCASSLFSVLVDAGSVARNALAAISEVRNASIHTHTGRVTALSHFELSFITRDDLRIKFSLEPNHDILGDDTTITYLSPEGIETRKRVVRRLDHKVFKGESWTWTTQSGWTRAGWARIILHKDGKKPFFEGGFSVAHDDYHIQSATTFYQTRHLMDPEINPREIDDQATHMVVWRNSDILSDNGQHEHSDLRRSVGSAGRSSCGADNLPFNVHPNHPVRRGFEKRNTGMFGSMELPTVFGKRQIDGTTTGNSAGGNLIQSIGNPAGCPNTRKVALIGIATDCTYTAQFDSDDAVSDNIVSMVNTASGVWENTFNISLGLQNVAISSANCPGSPPSATEWNQACSSSVDIYTRLNLFSAWRGSRPDNNTYWTLLSTCNTGSAIGLAWLGQACKNQVVELNGTATGDGRTSRDGQTVSGANVVIRTRGATEWQVFAHETGHTFGAVHDCYSATCPQTNNPNAERCCPLSANTCDANEQFIMNPAAISGVSRFSPCSIGNICSAMRRNFVSGDCLSDNRGVTTFTGQTCGNGIVEAGEDCDCGGPEGCTDNQCCDPNTCRFRSNAVCDDSNEDCCRGCQFATNGTVCRPSTGGCDPQETCSGTSAFCPENVHTPDGESCGDGLQCASGQCTSRDQQCRDAMIGYSQTNNTRSCDASSCVITCRNSEWPSNMCYGPQQNFLDGTNCGGGGRCSNGVCRGTSFGGEAGQWIRDNQPIVIGVSVAVGGLILILVLGCILRRCCGRSRRANRNMPRPAPPQMAPMNNGWYPPRQQSQHPSQGWFPNANTPQGGWQSPPVPPPAYSAARARYA